MKKQRQMTFEKQKAMGIIPKDAKLAPTPSEYQKWDALSPNMKKIVAREMEVYASSISLQRLSDRKSDPVHKRYG
ncbi:hypothetical protein [Flavobacterium ginsengisoli]|uniref:hypothetical protein n=1 Tax=Flavobacterium ginsengisoli TaxID=871694 RepID=UPI002414FBD4|nr:hypothetical protein [Flavobacterium ginsengisoli]